MKMKEQSREHYEKPELITHDSLRDLTANCSAGCPSPALWYQWTDTAKN